ncbi:hypothetical protein Mgra_00005754, partial [Meloidogyne graminicola]
MLLLITIMKMTKSSYQTWSCPNFDNSCKWHNSIWPTSSILWFQSSVPIDQNELKLFTNTDVRPDLYYAISAFGPLANNTVNNNTVIATLISEPIDCQKGNGNLTFNYWVSPLVQLTICIKLSGHTLNTSNDCQQLPTTNQGPGPAFVTIPEPNGQFQLIIESSNFVYSSPQLSGGFAILDNINYTAYFCDSIATTQTTIT